MGACEPTKRSTRIAISFFSSGRPVGWRQDSHQGAFAYITQRHTPLSIGLTLSRSSPAHVHVNLHSAIINSFAERPGLHVHYLRPRPHPYTTFARLQTQNALAGVRFRLSGAPPKVHAADADIKREILVGAVLLAAVILGALQINAHTPGNHFIGPTQKIFRIIYRTEIDTAAWSPRKSAAWFNSRGCVLLWRFSLGMLCSIEHAHNESGWKMLKFLFGA